MRIEITIYRSEHSEAKLSTIHSESSFGRPVLLVDGQAYRPTDILPSGLSADELVQLFLIGGNPEKGMRSRRSKRAVAIAEKFK
jgi:hypothetical protein